MTSESLLIDDLGVVVRFSITSDFILFETMNGNRVPVDYDTEQLPLIINKLCALEGAPLELVRKQVNGSRKIVDIQVTGANALRLGSESTMQSLERTVEIKEKVSQLYNENNPPLPQQEFDRRCPYLSDRLKCWFGHGEESFYANLRRKDKDSLKAHMLVGRQLVVRVPEVRRLDLTIKNPWLLSIFGASSFAWESSHEVWARQLKAAEERGADKQSHPKRFSCRVLSYLREDTYLIEIEDLAYSIGIRCYAVLENKMRGRAWKPGVFDDEYALVDIEPFTDNFPQLLSVTWEKAFPEKETISALFAEKAIETSEKTVQHHNPLFSRKKTAKDPYRLFFDALSNTDTEKFLETLKEVVRSDGRYTETIGDSIRSLRSKTIDEISEPDSRSNFLTEEEIQGGLEDLLGDDFDL